MPSKYLNVIFVHTPSSCLAVARAPLPSLRVTFPPPPTCNLASHFQALPSSNLSIPCYSKIFNLFGPQFY